MSQSFAHHNFCNSKKKVSLHLKLNYAFSLKIYFIVKHIDNFEYIQYPNRVKFQNRT